MRILVLMLALLLPLACLAQDEIIFPHDLHFEEGVECATCHDGVAEATSIARRFRPEMDVCADCHEVDDDEQCTMCHTSPDDAGDYPVPVFGAQIFPHAPHSAAGLECATCHGDPASEHPSMPGKPECRACHATQDFFADCALCHADPARPLPADHRAGWRFDHGPIARTEPAACYQCHTETGCQECHAGDNVRPRSHGLNFVFGHAIEARGNELECATCHQDPQYCSSCHVAERVMPRSHSRADWTSSTDGGRHALDAVFEMEQCIACHDAGSSAPTCARCHGG